MGKKQLIKELQLKGCKPRAQKEQEKDNYVGECLYPKVDEARKLTELFSEEISGN